MKHVAPPLNHYGREEDTLAAGRPINKRTETETINRFDWNNERGKKDQLRQSKGGPRRAPNVIRAGELANRAALITLRPAETPRYFITVRCSLQQDASNRKGRLPAFPLIAA